VSVWGYTCSCSVAEPRLGLGRGGVIPTPSAILLTKHLDVSCVVCLNANNHAQKILHTLTMGGGMDPDPLDPPLVVVFCYMLMYVCCFGLVVSTCQVIGWKDPSNDTLMWWGDYLHKAQVEESVYVYFSFVWFVYVPMCSPDPTQYIFHTSMTWYSLFVLKVSLNTNKTNQTCLVIVRCIMYIVLMNAISCKTCDTVVCTWVLQVHLLQCK